MDRLRGGILVTTASKVRAYSFMVYVAGDRVKDLAILVGMACSGRMVTDGANTHPPTQPSRNVHRSTMVVQELAHRRHGRLAREPARRHRQLYRTGRYVLVLGGLLGLLGLLVGAIDEYVPCRASPTHRAYACAFHLADHVTCYTSRATL